ncbi:MAG: stage II sporulation protein M [archaeon]
MLESLINPKRAERKPWEMFFIGLLYASVSLLIVDWIFLKDTVLSQYVSILIVTFTVMCSMPFFYFIIRMEEIKDVQIGEERILIKEHGKAIAALIYLFMGFVIAFAFWYIVLPSGITSQNFKAQVEQYCAINSPDDFARCVGNVGVKDTITGNAVVTGGMAYQMRHFVDILVNNLYVLVFTLIFSLTFGAGAIFILAWNASVIAAAIGIFTEASLHHFHMGIMRYFIHGIPEISAYFVGALAGGIISVSIIRHDFKDDKFWKVLQDSVDLIIVAIIILVISAFIEVFITPSLF